MSAAPQPTASPRRLKPITPRTRSARHAGQKRSLGHLTPVNVSDLNQHRLRSHSSLWLKLLHASHSLTTVTAAGLVTAVLGVYGYGVRVEQQLQASIQHLDQLQRSEQQLTTANELLKHHMATQVERADTGLQPPQPDKVIFLEPAPSRPAVAAPPRLRSSLASPLGY